MAVKWQAALTSLAMTQPVSRSDKRRTASALASTTQSVTAARFAPEEALRVASLPCKGGLRLLRLWPVVQLDQALAHSVLDQIDTSTQVELFPNVRTMALDCTDADA